MAEQSGSIRYQRSKAVKQAWAHERELVAQGRGTREWTVAEQKELLKTGKVKGYQGHHMKSVAKHPEYAGDRKNIQFLDSRKGNNEHLKAHRGDYHNESDGRYNVRTQKIREMKDGKPRAMNSYELKNKAVEKRGYTKYAKEDPRARSMANKKQDRRTAVKQSPKKSEKTAKANVKVESGRKTDAKANARYGKAASNAKPGVKQSGVKSGYGSKSSGVKASGPRAGGYGKGGQSGGKGSSGGGKGGQSSGGKGAASGGGHGGR